MLGNPKKPVTILFNPQEVVALSHKYSTTESMYAAFDVWAAWVRDGHKKREADWELRCMLSAIFDAGRLQGIREERARRRKEAHHA